MEINWFLFLDLGALPSVHNSLRWIFLRHIHSLVSDRLWQTWRGGPWSRPSMVYDNRIYISHLYNRACFSSWRAFDTLLDMVPQPQNNHEREVATSLRSARPNATRGHQSGHRCTTIDPFLQTHTMSLFQDTTNSDSGNRMKCKQFKKFANLT